jgi:hypothetical protein
VSAPRPRSWRATRATITCWAEVEVLSDEELDARMYPPPLDQRVFVREIGQVLLERGHLCGHLRALGLQARDRRRHDFRRHRDGLLVDRRHQISLTRRDLTAQARTDVAISESAVAVYVASAHFDERRPHHRGRLRHSTSRIRERVYGKRFDLRAHGRNGEGRLPAEVDHRGSG